MYLHNYYRNNDLQLIAMRNNVTIGKWQFRMSFNFLQPSACYNPTLNLAFWRQFKWLLQLCVNTHYWYLLIQSKNSFFGCLLPRYTFFKKNIFIYTLQVVVITPRTPWHLHSTSWNPDFFQLASNFYIISSMVSF